MPNNYDFSNLQNIKRLKISLEGWVQPLYIEYGLGLYGGVPSYFWRVIGTKHTFIIPVLRLNYLSAGDYEKHFSEVLKKFREDYIEWAGEEFYIPWMSEYRDQFSKFINI